MIEIDLRSNEVGKLPLEHFPELSSYLRLVDKFGFSLSLHGSRDPGLYWLSGHNRGGDHRPVRLDLDGVRAVRDACDLILADHDNPTDSPSSTDQN